MDKDIGRIVEVRGINVKAKLDGDYTEHISFGFDMKCFFGTIISVLKHEGVVEGGTGKMNKEKSK